MYKIEKIALPCRAFNPVCKTDTRPAMRRKHEGRSFSRDMRLRREEKGVKEDSLKEIIANLRPQK